MKAPVAAGTVPVAYLVLQGSLVIYCVIAFGIVLRNLAHRFYLMALPPNRNIWQIFAEGRAAPFALALFVAVSVILGSIMKRRSWPVTVVVLLEFILISALWLFLAYSVTLGSLPWVEPKI